MKTIKVFMYATIMGFAVVLTSCGNDDNVGSMISQSSTEESESANQTPESADTTKQDVNQELVVVEYQPLVKEGKTWIFGNPVHDTGYRHMQFFSGDTIIGQMKYQKLYSANSKEDAVYYEGAYREVNKKVYYVSKGKPSTEESLIYDFSLSVGELFHYEGIARTFFPSSQLKAEMTVEKIDTVEYYGRYYREFVFLVNQTLPVAYLYQMSWIEGLGSGLPLPCPIEDMVDPKSKEAKDGRTGGNILFGIEDDGEIVYGHN